MTQLKQIEPGYPAYMADALHTELLTPPFTMNKETLTGKLV
jgi:hypothetical protein